MSILKKIFSFFNKWTTNPTKKKLDLERLLSSENINNSIIEIDDFICSLGDDELTDQQKNFYFNQNLEREINNGGFSQYFLNSSGDFTHETITSLKAINAFKTADILQKAIEPFPDKVVPKNRDERQLILEKIQKSANGVWEALDQKFFIYEDDLNTLNIEYVRRNKDSF